jgi:MFS family permease
MIIRRRWLVLVGACAIYAFASATTFQSMGLVIFAMARDLHWSEAEAGGTFLSFGLVCAATSMLPVVTIPRIGGRWTIVLGSLILALGFSMAYAATALSTFYLATALFGFGFSLVANACGVYLIAGWFGARTPRMIGVYLVSGTLSGVIAPFVAQALIADGWRLHWFVMSVVALALACVCAILLKEPVTADHAADDARWRLRDLFRTPQFAMLAFAMVLTQAAIITVASVAPPHLVHLGKTSDFAARILGVQALIGTVATAVSGWLGEHTDSRKLLLAGLLAESLGMFLFAVAQADVTGYAFALAFGIGWSVTSVAITVLLVDYFGHTSGSMALAAIWMFSGVATAVPTLAGWVADASGSFAPALIALGLLLLPAALAAYLVAPPRMLAVAAETLPD